MHRLPHDHDLVPPWRLVVALGLLTLAVCGLGAWATRLAFDLNALWWLPVAPVLQWFGMRYVAGRGGGEYAPQEGPEPDDSPTQPLAAVEEDSPDSGHRSGDLGLSAALDRPGRHALREEPEVPEPKPSPVRRAPEPVRPQLPELTPDRFDPFPLKQIEGAALAIWTARTNFNRIRPLNRNEAAKQYATLNRYLKEQLNREAHAALSSKHDKDEFWDRQMERMIDWFNPPDEDAACESIVLDAIERAYKFAESQPCQCVEGFEPDEVGDYEACPRCRVLGRVNNKAVQR